MLWKTFCSPVRKYKVFLHTMMRWRWAQWKLSWHQEKILRLSDLMQQMMQLQQ